MDEMMFLFALMAAAILTTALLLFVIARLDKRILKRLEKIERSWGAGGKRKSA